MQALYRRWVLEENGGKRVLKNIDYSALDLKDAITLVIKVRVKNDSVDLTTKVIDEIKILEFTEETIKLQIKLINAADIKD